MKDELIIRGELDSLKHKLADLKGQIDFSTSFGKAKSDRDILIYQASTLTLEWVLDEYEERQIEKLLVELEK